MMYHSIHASLLPAVVVGWLTAVEAALAGAPPIQDHANFFEPAVAGEAGQAIRQIRNRHHKYLVIETMEKPPRSWFIWSSVGKVKAMDQEARNQYFTGLLKKRAYPNSIYVLICKDPLHVQVAVGNGPEMDRAFPSEDRAELRNLVAGRFEEKEYDQGLREAVAFVERRLDANMTDTAADASTFTWTGMLEIILSILGFWVVLGMIRAFRRTSTPHTESGADVQGSGGSLLTGLFATLAAPASQSAALHGSGVIAPVGPAPTEKPLPAEGTEMNPFPDEGAPFGEGSAEKDTETHISDWRHG